jgi:asparagine synthase (glutamine-hydrolysing)
MCGIAGIFNHSVQYGVDRESLIRMRDCMVHRGPDDSGVYITADRSVGLAHRRLSIIDLSAAAAQPMSDDTGKIWVTFNGEIYNYRELRQDLEKDGIVFRTKSDTEVLLYLFKKYGGEMVHHLRGMFAFAILDENQRTLFLARDRMGVKPLYYFNRGGRFAFASEIKALLSTGIIQRDVNAEAFHHYLSFLTTPAPQTLFEGIFKLPAGYRMVVKASGDVKIDQWWSPLQQPLLRNPSEEACIRDIRDLLKESIRYRMVSDVPFGVFLSGGIDSSTNVGLMAEMMDRPVETFSIAFKDETRYNEFQFARKVAEKFHANHHEIEIGMNDLLDFLPQLIYHQDEPIADPVCIPVYYVAKLAKDHGVTVCQVGEGSDELFCGYPHWSYVLGLERYRRPYALIPQPLRRIAAFFARQIDDPLSTRLEYIRRASFDEPVFWGGAEAFNEAQKRSLLHPDMLKRLNGTTSANVVGQYFKEMLGRRDRPDSLTWMTFIDLKLRLPELLLMRVDKMTMATSVEARVPFLDHKLVEYAMSIPQDLKVPGLQPKYLLKKAVRGLIPDEIIDRPKQGFGVPVVEWFERELGTMIREKLMAFSKNQPYLNADRMERFLSQPNSALPWYLFNFVLWHETWIEQKVVA